LLSSIAAYMACSSRLSLVQKAADKGRHYKHVRR
jgi:hypothetical protein